MTKIIGQEDLKQTFERYLERSNLPHFIILAGAKGAGKELFTQYIAEKFNFERVGIGVSVDSVREMIEMSHAVAVKTVYVIANADKMSAAAKNALLKVTEEPSLNAYFIITLQNVMNTLPTIRSRATVLYMDTYTAADIAEYIKTLSLQGKEEALALQAASLCATPGEVEDLLKSNIQEFNDYVELVINNIDKTSGSNAFKIADKISTKEDDGKYDMALFFRAFINRCGFRMKSDSDKERLKYVRGVITTSQYASKLAKTNCNKIMLINSWILDIRREWCVFEER